MVVGVPSSSHVEHRQRTEDRQRGRSGDPIEVPLDPVTSVTVDRVFPRNENVSPVFTMSRLIFKFDKCSSPHLKDH